ncbi:hypothetical protein Leucomu_13055 [Leucobacter muris]|uniref:Cytochrome c domain-containing protein n=1 Tax=Leucobacter muris TaxID=1935379 RepID=A0ABX5QIF3_9MICO|nr:hypothetical protein [Leucobacter muris]QAB18714.1 hypothetical protein Leucomu_13055 [Leucobacter muris]
MSKMTAERIIEEVLHPFPERVWLSHRIVARLRAAGLLVGDPTEEQIERASIAFSCETVEEWRDLGEEVRRMIRGDMRDALTAAVGVAPQEPSPVASTPTVSDDSGHGGDDDRGGREDGPEDEGRSHQATVAGTPQRPSGCAECHRSEGHKMDCSHRFAAQPVLDPEKVADVLRREDWTDELWDGLPQSDRDRTWALLLEAATRISSAAKRGELT